MTIFCVDPINTELPKSMCNQLNNGNVGNVAPNSQSIKDIIFFIHFLKNSILNEYKTRWFFIIGEEKRLFIYAGLPFFKCYEKIICGEFCYNEFSPSHAVRGLKIDQRGEKVVQRCRRHHCKRWSSSMSTVFSGDDNEGKQILKPSYENSGNSILSKTKGHRGEDLSPISAISLPIPTGKYECRYVANFDTVNRVEGRFAPIQDWLLYSILKYVLLTVTTLKHFMNINGCWYKNLFNKVDKLHSALLYE
ncbi:hypothetical protein AGLY_013068 [Aphis glycines]|uniref:Uncharacterized protein n=1 Tax=Aphis glycines TaxID=307491 RepID=A0A6G0T7T4_APHGL|nr:hypothetical protein AGLY_013068 [Aphis glycines]